MVPDMMMCPELVILLSHNMKTWCRTFGACSQRVDTLNQHVQEFDPKSLGMVSNSGYYIGAKHVWKFGANNL